MTDPERTLLLAVARVVLVVINAQSLTGKFELVEARDKITAALKPFDDEAKVHSKRERWEKRDKP